MGSKCSYSPALRLRRHGKKLFAFFGAAGSCNPGCNSSEKQIDNGRREKRQYLADQKSTDNADPQRFSQFRTDAATEGERYSAEKCGHRGHHDRTEAQEARLIDGLLRRFIF